jgi:hypothetical protein
MLDVGGPCAEAFWLASSEKLHLGTIACRSRHFACCWLTHYGEVAKSIAKCEEDVEKVGFGTRKFLPLAAVVV